MGKNNLNPSPMEIRECQLCSSVDPVILHNVPHDGSFALLCTACVLRRHAGSFCPICFDLYEEGNNGASDATQLCVTCYRCPAAAHRTCFSFSTLPYLCPQCSNPSLSFFKTTTSDGQPIPFTKDLARQVICAAKIASVSAHKAAAMAKADAELNVREAMLARRVANDAIDRVSYLMANEQMQDHSDVDDE